MRNQSNCEKYLFRIPERQEIEKISAVLVKDLNVSKKILITVFIIVAFFCICFFVGCVEDLRTEKEWIKALPSFALTVIFASFAVTVFRGYRLKKNQITDLKNGTFGVMDCICTDVHRASEENEHVFLKVRIYPEGKPENITDKMYPVYNKGFRECNQLENKPAWLVRIEQYDKEYVCIK